MTDWSRLSHAYGPADDIPDLLDRIASAPTAELWSDLWSALCHQGTVYPAGFAALPWLAGRARCGEREQEVQAVLLAGAILAGAGPSHGVDDVRARFATETAALLVAANRQLGAGTDPTDYVHLLEAVLGLEGVPGWGEELAWGIVNEEYQIACPDCEGDLFIALGERGFFSAADDYALTDGAVETRPLRPAAPADLNGIGRRLHDRALADGRQEVAHVLTHVFGHATCPSCEADFAVADRIVADPSGR
ncbi:hypothetical protein GCM10009639_01800 [Kitasatospora putterlickiae]|uniref:Uncharacterized protein n=1 Tax=Kitasatospora putterlickiae TaxID=221725 RepID=A0ABP4I9L1_9ACTN